MTDRLRLTAVIAVVCGMLAAGCGPQDKDIAGCGSTPAQLECIDSLIEQLALSSQPAADRPIYTPAPDTPSTDPRVPAYEAAEQLRALGKAAFPKLLEHLDDDRQSICLRRTLPCSVRLACFSIMEHQIFLFPDDFVCSIYRTGQDGQMHGRPMFFEPRLFNPSTIESWLDERKDRSLTEIQIEALEWMLAHEVEIGFRNNEDKEKYLHPLQRKLAQLRSQRG